MMAQARRTSVGTEDVRMGPVAIFTLMAIICLSVLAVLALSTANATQALAQRRAEATTQLYLDETAAQTFVATLDAGYSGGATAQALEDAQAAARQATGDAVAITAARNGNVVEATFDAGNGRHLDITVRLEPDGTIGIDKWRMTTVVNEEPTMGNLFGSS